MLFKEFRARNACLFAQESNQLGPEVDCRAPIPPFGIGTGRSTTDEKILRSYVAMLSGVPSSCRAFSVHQLGYQDDCQDLTGGRFDIFDLKVCLFEDHRAAVGSLLELPFPSAPVCGDAVVKGDEECDDGNNVDTDACRNDCTLARCGDGVVCSGGDCRTGPGGGAEVCDDGNTTETDACLNDCSPASCGDGIVWQGVEDCDDQNTNNNDACLNTCIAAACGDGVLCSDFVSCTTGPGGGAEICDDGNTASNDGCNDICAPEFCGDGITQSGLGEECDDGAGNSNTTPDACRTDCKLPACGDGVVDPGAGEACDDGNTATGDGCDAQCQREKCGNGVVDADEGEECDDGNSVDTDACRNNCKLAVCGDGVTCSDASCTTGPGGGVEQCDDAGESASCDSDCTPAQCGDGTVNATAGEQCDDVGESATCDADCTTAQCGDGTVNATAGESCDDGGESAACDDDCTPVQCGDGNANQAAGEECDDGGESGACDADCTLAVCGDGTVNGTAGEECDDGNTISGDGCSSVCTCSVASGSGEGGCQDPQCPNKGELTLLAGVGPICASNADCLGGQCDPGLGRCVTPTNLDTGYKGVGMDADVNHGVVMVSNLLCEGQSQPVPGEPCGVCEIKGIDPGPGNCRCAGGQDCTSNADCATGAWCDTAALRPVCKGANRIVCDEPFQPDNDDCGGMMCDCYFGPPLPLSAGNTPACVVNRFAQDITGTGNVDKGEGEISAHLRSVVYLGFGNFQPCPYCTGDTVLGDGVRDGVCVKGDDDGQPCDASAINATFPVPGGDAYSLDCFPPFGLNVSGSGLRIDLTQSTTHQELPFQVPCLRPPRPGAIARAACPCGLCKADQSIPCHSDAECAGTTFCPDSGKCSLDSSRTCTLDADCDLGLCKRNKCQNDKSVACLDDTDCQLGPCTRHCNGDGRFQTCTANADCASLEVCDQLNGSVPAPHDCSAGGQCVPGPNGQGECSPAFNIKFCDGFVRANGKGFLQCFTNADCSASGADGGACSLLENKPCFLDPIVAEGVADPQTPIGAAIFCIPPTSSQGINAAAGLPGPGRVVNQGRVRTFCASDPSVEYVPGVGGCP